MSFDTKATMSQSNGQGHEAAAFATSNGTGRASGTQSTERLRQARSVLNESADEEAFRLRTSGMTYRQIGEKMGVDQSMAHRRVKRQMMRQKMYLNEKLEEARDFELDKLRQMEQAILPDATSGDHSAIKLVLRIMEMRRKYLKDIPLERGELYPSIEDRAEMLAEVVDAEWERKGRPGAEAEPSVDRGMAEAFLARMWERTAEAVQQKLAAERVTANEAASTEGSRRRSTKPSMDDAGSKDRQVAHGP